MVDPVLKSFGALASVVLVVLLTPFAYGDAIRPFTWGLGATLGFMTFLLLVEIGFIVHRETRELYEFGRSGNEPA